jgi:hypothetical protein
LEYHQAWLEGVHRIVLLAAGIAGVVVPLLAEKTLSKTPPLHAGMIMMFWCVGSGVLVQLIARFFLAGFGGHFASTLKTRSPLTSGLFGFGTACVEIVMYGCFLRGAWLIASGFFA